MDELEISGKRYISTRRAGKEYKYHSDYIGQLIRGNKLVGRKVGRSWYVELDSLSTYFGEGGSASVQDSEFIATSVVEVPAAAVVEPVAEVAAIAEVTPVAIAEAVEEKIVEQPIVIVEPIVEPIPAEIVEEKIKINIAAPVNENISKHIDEPVHTPASTGHVPIRIQRPSSEYVHIKKPPVLTYIADDAPYIPTATKAPRSHESSTIVMTQIKKYADEELAEDVFESDEVEVKANTRRSFLPIVGVVTLGIIVLVAVAGFSVMVNSKMVIEAGKTASVGFGL